MSKQIRIVATGGTTFQVFVDGEFIGSTEFGSITEDGQYEQTDAEIIEHVREVYDLPGDAEALVA